MEELHFKFPWRSYQKRVLDELNDHLSDAQLHVVAAPGSGKTVLGLEVMRRLGKPSIVFAPSLAIRNQWKTRLVDLFMPEGSDLSWISLDIRRPRLLTISTYQGLHAAISGEPDEENESSDEPLGEALFQMCRDLGVGTLIFDEAHHLRKEWYHSLVQLKQALPAPVQTVSLTATPPYDADASEWANYESLCGSVDCEISIPELVKSGDLCPHQDLVCFSAPTGPEADFIETFARDLNTFAYELLNDSRFLSALSNMPWFLAPGNCEDEILGNADFFLAGLVFLKASGRPVHPAALDFCGLKLEELPELNRQLLEQLLRGVISEEFSRCFDAGQMRKDILKRLRSFGGLHRGQPMLADLNEANKLLRNSLGKIQCVRSIVAAECSSLGNALRMVILTDYIHRDQMQTGSKGNYQPAKIGVVPLFEVLRDNGEYHYKLGVLTGSLVILPSDAKPAFRAAARERGIADGDIRFRQLRHDKDYVEVELKGPFRHEMVHVVTEVFQKGEVTVLVGTQSLLGEGWDAPSINSLVLASIVGSFMLSNQMRGRAIRNDPRAPGKVANIWHLACINLPELSNPLEGLINGRKLIGTGAGMKSGWNPIREDLGEDYDLLCRRFKAFEGLTYSEPVLIVSGLQRMGVSHVTWSAEGLSRINGATFAKSADRKAVAHKWHEALVSCAPETRLRPTVTTRGARQRWIYRSSIGVLAAGGSVVLIFALVLSAALSAGASIQAVAAVLVLGAIAALLAAPKLLKSAGLLLRNWTVEGNLRQVGKALLETLRHSGQLHTPVGRLKFVVRKQGAEHYCYLEGAAPKERELFLSSLEQVLGNVGKPKYILVRKFRFFGKVQVDYHPVPEAIAGKKSHAAHFAKCWRRLVSNAELVSVRSQDGRRELLHARAQSLSASFVSHVQRLGRWA
ncbi:MAG: DEAD/DEAH box helicase family protein [Pseudomonadota bacterium]